MYDRVGRMGSTEVPRDPILKVSELLEMNCNDTSKENTP